MAVATLRLHQDQVAPLARLLLFSGLGDSAIADERVLNYDRQQSSLTSVPYKWVTAFVTLTLFFATYLVAQIHVVNDRCLANTWLRHDVK